MNKTIIAILALLLVVACSGDGMTGNVTSGKEVIKIGAIGPLSGESALLGENQRKGIGLALENLGETKYEYQVIYEDDQLKNARTVSAYQKLSGADNVDAIIGLSSGSGNAIAALAESDQTIFCSISSDPAIVEGREYVFKHWVTPRAEAERYIEEAKSLGWKRIATFESNQQGTLAVSQELDNYAALAGIEIEHNIVDTNVKDVRTLILKAQENEFDAIYVMLLPEHQLAILKQLREMKIDKPITSIESFEFIDEGLDIIEGEWYINTGDPSGKYSEMFRAKYGEQPGFATANAYDCLNIIVKAFEEGGPSAQEAVGVIHNLKDYEGAMGELLYYQDGSIESPAIKKMVKDGAFVSLE